MTAAPQGPRSPEPSPPRSRPVFPCLFVSLSLTRRKEENELLRNRRTEKGCQQAAEGLCFSGCLWLSSWGRGGTLLV